MNVAIVHDYLSQMGGAERITLQIASLLPDAPIFTSFFDSPNTFAEFSRRDVRTSSVQDSINPDRFRRSVLRYPRAFRNFDFTEFDLVIVSTSAFAHHIRHQNSYVYCHTPPRFLYDPGAYGRGEPSSLSRFVSTAFLPLRRADRSAARNHVSYAANSAVTATRLRRVYGMVSRVIHPTIALDSVPEELSSLPEAPRALMICRLLRYKRVDIGIEACARAGIPVTVVGEGPDRRRLEKLAGTHVDFLGRISDHDLTALWPEHSMVLAPGVEDFGLGPVEANYAGRPVVAIKAGGALETVIHGVNGFHVPSQSPAEWSKAIVTTASRRWTPASLRETTTPFQAPAFRRAIADWLPSGVIEPERAMAERD